MLRKSGSIYRLTSKIKNKNIIKIINYNVEEKRVDIPMNINNKNINKIIKYNVEEKQVDMPINIINKK